MPPQIGWPLRNPLVAALVTDTSMAGVADVVQRGLANGDPTEASASMDLVLEKLGVAADQVAMGDSTLLNWTDEFLPLDERRYQLIYLKPKSSFALALPDAEVVAALRQLVAQLDLPGDTRVQLTGEITLQHEEIEAAVDGVSVAGWLAVGLLFVVLVAGVRSGKIVLATFSMLALGIAWTAAYAMLTVGEFNTLSLVFIVMFFGLGVDFALHFCLRFQESVNAGTLSADDALLATTRSVGRAISLCALTTAVGFMGFWPTAYQGLADLGVISAGGMLIAWFLTFTYLPAFFATFGHPRAHTMNLPTTERLVNTLVHQRKLVVAAIVVVGLGAGVIATKAEFDYSVLALKDPTSESMQALRELQRNELATDYQLVALSEEPLAPEDLQTLGTVREVSGLNDLVPDAQTDKLAVLEDLGFVFWELLDQPRLTVRTEGGATDIRMAIHSMLDALAGAPQGNIVSTPKSSEFVASMQGLLEQPDATLVAWQQVVLENLVAELNWLKHSLQVKRLAVTDIPPEILERVVSPEGQYLNTIAPAGDITAVAPLTEFITEVRAHQANATGRPVIEWGVGEIVVTAFQQAALFALVGIVIILLITLRKIGPTLLIMTPLVLAGVCTFALGVLIGQSVNMANVLVLPLIFGLGVDNGIHVVERYLGRDQGVESDRFGAVSQLMHSSTPRAVLLSTLTTIGAFAALAISPHQEGLHPSAYC